MRRLLLLEVRAEQQKTMRRTSRRRIHRCLDGFKRSLLLVSHLKETDDPGRRNNAGHLFVIYIEL